MARTNTTAKLKIDSATGPAPGAAVKTAKLFKNGRSQAVRLPKEFRFEGTEVTIRRDLVTGEVVMAHAISRPTHFPDDFIAAREEHAARSSWQDLFAEWDALGSAEDTPLERNQNPPVERDFF